MEGPRITVQDVKRSEKLAALIEAANRMLEVIGYTEHGPRHVGFVSHTASSILEQLHYPQRMCELAAIAGWVHDVGNAVNRVNHGITGGAMLFPLLLEMGMPVEEVVTIVGAVGNHEEQNGKVVSAVSAALIIADKSDAHRTRVRRASYNPDDIHDRVNLAAESIDARATVTLAGIPEMPLTITGNLFKPKVTYKLIGAVTGTVSNIGSTFLDVVGGVLTAPFRLFQ